MRKTLITLILIITNLLIFGQQKSEIFPDNLNIQPFVANQLEPRLGFLFRTNVNELNLSIGSSMDILKYQLQDNSYFAFGADLFTYTLLRSEENFHFPVDAVDYLFGINFTYKKNLKKFEYGARLRVSHISAHFVDGHFDYSKNIWRNGRNPRVYSREFFELTPYIKLKNLRMYTGLTYIFSIDPRDLGKDNYQIGFDYFLKNFISSTITPFLGYDLKLIHLDKYSANNSFAAGIKFGKPNGRGFSIYYNYYSGKSLNGEYFDFNKEYSALGINLDL